MHVSYFSSEEIFGSCFLGVEIAYVLGLLDLFSNLIFTDYSLIPLCIFLQRKPRNIYKYE